MIEHRRSRRRRVQTSIEVYDAMSEEVIGHLGNLSVDGLLMVSRRPIPDDALFQFMFTLPRGVSAHSRRIEVGVHEQWSEAARSPGQYWTGFRIIDISREDLKALDDWIGSPGGQFA
jgi:hypothetical protein